jgi:hypothetical protein
MEPSLRSRVRDGDPDAFGVLFDDSARAVHNLAFRDPGGAEDLARAPALPPSAPLRLWQGQPD